MTQNSLTTFFKPKDAPEKPQAEPEVAAVPKKTSRKSSKKDSEMEEKKVASARDSKASEGKEAPTKKAKKVKERVSEVEIPPEVSA